MITVTEEEARTHFEELLDTVQRESVTITQHGRAAAVLVSPLEMKDLLGASFKQNSAVEAFENYFAKSDGAMRK